MIVRGLVLVMLVLLGWWTPIDASSAKVRCTVESATDLVFDLANDTVAVPPAASTSRIEVSCVGNNRWDAHERELVCVGVDSNEHPKRMERVGGGGSGLDYDIYRDSGHNQPLDFRVNAAEVITLGPDPSVPVHHVFTFYGQVGAGQAPPREGNYRDGVEGVMGHQPSGWFASCDNTGLDERFRFSARTYWPHQCMIAVTPLDFGTPTTGLDLDVDADATLSVTCTPQTPYTVSFDAGLHAAGNIADRRMKHASSAATIDYDLFLDAAHTRRWGNDSTGSALTAHGTGYTQGYTVHGLVPSVPTSQSPAVGNYTDQVTATIEY